MRYLVLSYVTNPTTINAITEIPAKTPSPIGRTESFLPGNSNAGSAVGETCSTAVPLASVVVVLGGSELVVEGAVVSAAAEVVAAAVELDSVAVTVCEA